MSSRCVLYDLTGRLEPIARDHPSSDATFVLAYSFVVRRTRAMGDALALVAIIA